MIEETKQIKYRSGYKYQLAETAIFYTIITNHDIHTHWIKLDTTGRLTIKLGYAWDGPSGPAIDTKNFMRGSLVHDALYQLMRMGLLSTDYRKKADIVLDRICREDGMCKLRRMWVLRALRRFAAGAANPKNKKKVYIAP